MKVGLHDDKGTQDESHCHSKTQLHHIPRLALLAMHSSTSSLPSSAYHCIIRVLGKKKHWTTPIKILNNTHKRRDKRAEFHALLYNEISVTSNATTNTGLPLKVHDPQWLLSIWMGEVGYSIPFFPSSHPCHLFLAIPPFLFSFLPFLYILSLLCDV